MMRGGGSDRRGSPGRKLPRSLRFMLVASLLVPLLFLAAGGWYRHGQMMAAAAAEADRLSAIAREHALKVVETNSLVLDRMEDRIRGRSWAEVEAEAAAHHAWLRALDEEIAQIIALHFLRPDGETVAISLGWPTPPLNVAGRDYFQAMQQGAQGLVFGRPLRSPLSGQVGVVVGRALRGPEGRFDGAVIGAMTASYFETAWRAMDPGHRAAFGLVRADGVTLVSVPARDGVAPPDPAAVLAALRMPAGDGGALGRLDGHDDAFVALRRVGPYPLGITVALDLGQVRAAWWRDLAALALPCLLAAAALSFATLNAIRRWQSEQAVLATLRGEIARREEAEAHLLQSQRLEALGRLTGGVAHDFNNLLTAILGTVQMLEKHLGAAADERARRLLGMARDAVRRGAGLNQSLLAFARRQTLNATAVDANALVEGFAPLVQRALGEAVRLELALAPGLPPCRADAAQLESAILNLAINARDALPRGGTVRLETRQVELDTAHLAGNPDAAPGPFVAIALADEGTGMPPEVRERAFEPFFTTKPVGQGTGLGLSQVFGFVRQLGGHVAIESNPGCGTTVRLFLPVATPAADARPEPAGPGWTEATPGHPGATVLVAEDDARLRAVAVEMLEEGGFRVLAAGDGPEALALLRRGEPVDVLFSDIVMPGGMNGMELAEAARRLRAGLPVLLATGYAGAAGLDAAGFEVLAKPYERAALLRRLAELTAVAERSAA
ncbi:hybrid sensor histidine kinase/response regulator [Paracraurococcus lichenis]|uniref:histidine kinase n=1 Tax=Paracraurococcus lichenis TaxID=3064888 RepID=A0ABT9DUH8_9PROT|nr:hybrid sensor histidine kinase/response regulator [Paracraurococcus sp. LOR1-02]MDO9707558.1 response regulator [Paracraurococcus sp. LOR1-02]